jgi:DNA-binding MarR family transcriptional regulator
MQDYGPILTAIRRITRAIDLHSKRLVKRSGLTVPQLLVMQSILRQGTVTAIVDRLERQGLVRRERSGDDKRVVLVCLTLDGQKKLEEAPEPIQAGFVREFRKLSEWEQHMLISAFERVAVMMNAEEIDAAPILEVGELQDAPPANSG